MSLEVSRAATAAALHAISAAHNQNNNYDDSGNDNDDNAEGFSDRQSVCGAAKDPRWGDRWKSRGADGIWHRWHTSPRLLLFTPYKASKGPASSIALHQHRFTYGVMAAGKASSSTPTGPSVSVLYTVLTERSAESTTVQHKRLRKTMTATATSADTSSWADA